MATASKLEMLKYRLLVVELLRAAKSKFTYRELSRITGFDQTILARYVNGVMIPSYEHALRLWKSLKEYFEPSRVIAESISSFGGLLDLTPVLSDPLMLRLIAMEFLERFQGEDITRILVPETSGISLATALSIHFNVPLVVARRRKENPLEDYIEGHLVESPRIYRIFYVPRRQLTKGDRVLIVDDVVQTGLTLSVMEKIVGEARARIVGVAALVVVGDEWKSRSSIDKIEAILYLSVHPH